MNEQEKIKMAVYIAEYINEEINRGNTEVDKWMVLNAINSYLGGASDGETFLSGFRTGEIEARKAVTRFVVNTKIEEARDE